MRRGSWPTDFPRADRQFLQGVRRLTRLHTRSTEQVIDLVNDPNEIFNWPWVYAVQVGEWGLTEAEAHKLRDYLLRGGFFFADDVVRNFISFRDGTGFLAGPALVLFLLLFSFQVRFLRKIWGDRGLTQTLYGAGGSATVTGELSEIRQYCRGALY